MVGSCFFSCVISPYRFFTALVLWLERGCCGQSQIRTNSKRTLALPYGSELLIAQRNGSGMPMFVAPGPRLLIVGGCFFLDALLQASVHSGFARILVSTCWHGGVCECFFSPFCTQSLHQPSSIPQPRWPRRQQIIRCCQNDNFYCLLKSI